MIDAYEATKLGGFYITGNRINGKLTGLLNDSSDYVKFSGVQSGEQKTTLAATPYLSADSTGVNHGITNKAFDNYVKSGVKLANESLLKAFCNKRELPIHVAMLSMQELWQKSSRTREDISTLNMKSGLHFRLWRH